MRGSPAAVAARRLVTTAMTVVVVAAASGHAPATRARPPAAGAGGSRPGTGGVQAGLLDPAATLGRFDWWDNRDFDWYAANIPLLETPDREIDATYYYRWELVTKHLVYGSPEHGYLLTEFIDRPFWSGTYGAISCPLGYQLREVRWLRDRRFAEEFARSWFEVPGAQPRSYSNWYGAAVWAVYRVSGDRDFLLSVLPYMIRQYEGWLAERWHPEHGMFRWDGMHDGMESNINSRQTPRWFDGAEGYRPTLNSYLYGDALAIARAARLAGDEETAAAYEGRARALRERVLEELWDPAREFFFHQFAHREETVAEPWPGGADAAGAAAVAGARGDASAHTPPIEPFTLTYRSGPFAGDAHGRELIGYVPWQFGLPDARHASAWRFLMDPQRFRAPYGPRTVELHDPLYYVSPRCCVWSGNSWPYATTQTLVALANVLRGAEQEYVTPRDYFELLRTYTLTQRKQGRPYVAEAADPETGSWAGHDEYFHSEHYFHSGYVDLVITGLVGLRPQDDDRLVVDPLAPAEWPWFALDRIAYRGHDVAIVWDRDGRRYGRGAGLGVWVDGVLSGRRDTLGRLEVGLGPPPLRPLPERRVNWAVRNGRRWYPHATATSALPQYPPDRAQDGQYWYHRSPPNRWVARPGRTQDVFTVRFGGPRTIDTVKLYLLDDAAAPPDFVAEDAPSWMRTPALQGPPVLPPAAYRVQLLGEQGWHDVRETDRMPAVPQGRRANTVRFEPEATTAVRVWLRHRPGGTTGLSELETWGPAPGAAGGSARRSAGTAAAGGAPRPPSASGGAVALPDDVAFNPGDRQLPRATATFSAEGSDPSVLLDGETAYNYYTHARWSARGSPHAVDRVRIDLAEPATIEAVDVYLWAWESRGTAAPAALDVEVWDGDAWIAPRALERGPEPALPMARWRIRFEPLRTDRLQVSFTHARPAAAAASEIVVWRAGALAGASAR